jgi:hypothetical protein
MHPRRFGFLLFLPLALTSLLAACAAPAPTPTALAATNTPVLPTVTITPLPPTTTPTVTATLIPSETPTITPTPTPAAAFDQIQIMAVERIVSGVRINLFIPKVSVAYDLKIQGYEYTCGIDAKTKDHLFCVGLADIQPDQTITLELLDPQSGAQVYATQIFYASYPTAIPAGNAGNNCADRGTGVSCEVECRQLPAGGYCVVATCTDACGLYRSVQTCPEGMTDFTSCTQDEWDEAKRIYGFP